MTTTGNSVRGVQKALCSKICDHICDMISKASESKVIIHSVNLSRIGGSQPRHDRASVARDIGIVTVTKGIAIMLVSMKCIGNDLK